MDELLVDHRGIINWEVFQILITETAFNAYHRGLQDVRDDTVSLSSVGEVVSEMNEELQKHYYE